MGEVSTFVKENRDALGRNIKGLNRVAKVLVKQRGALDEILTNAPLALNNLYLTYNPQAGTLDTRSNQGEVAGQIDADPAAFLCGLVSQADTSGRICDAIENGGLPGLPLPRAAAFGQGGLPPTADRFDQTPRRTRGGGAMTTMKKLRSLLLVLAASLVLTGCDFDVYKLPLPGGTDTGDNPITVHAKFHDVLDLVPQVDGQGQRRQRRPGHRHRPRGVRRRRDPGAPRRHRSCPTTPIAELRQTSLLGEKFVSLSPPEEGASANPLQTGDIITLDRTGRNPEVEEVLGALSLLLNGGGVAQLKTIAHELNLALEGREGSTKSVLRQIEALMTQLDANKADIVNAIESLNRLAISVNDQTDSIDSALEELPSALTSLDQQRDDLVKMLKALNRLGDVGVRVIKASKESTIESFRQLNPVLTELANSGDDFVNAFHVFLTYPFVDEVVGRDPQVARNLHMGDYTNLSIELDLALTDDGGLTPPTNLPSDLDPTVILSAVVRCLQSGDLGSRACQQGAGDPPEAAAAPGGVRQAEERGQGHLQAAQPGPRPADPEQHRWRRPAHPDPGPAPARLRPDHRAGVGEGADHG